MLGRMAPPPRESIGSSIQLADVFLICSIPIMTRIDKLTVADALLNAPGWARVGLCAPTLRMREEAARELARVILDRECPPIAPCSDQTQLPL